MFYLLFGLRKDIKKLMGDVSKLQTAFTQLQTDVNGLVNLITNNVIPDIEKAIGLIQGGSDQAAIDALTASVTALDAATSPVTANLQAADTNLEGSET